MNVWGLREAGYQWGPGLSHFPTGEDGNIRERYREKQEDRPLCERKPTAASVSGKDNGQCGNFSVWTPNTRGKPSLSKPPTRVEGGITGSPCPEQAALSARPVSRAQSPRLTEYLVLSSSATHGIIAARCWEGPALPASIERTSMAAAQSCICHVGFSEASVHHVQYENNSTTCFVVTVTS